MSSHRFKVYKGTPTGEIIEAVTERPSLTGDQVLISVTHSGVCATDEHYLCSGIALGHEGVGIVEKTGPAVKALKVGDRVGWGYTSGDCGICDSCISGFPIRCESGQPKIYGFDCIDSGSFATSAIRSEAFLFQIPDDLPSDAAAPLMCGGITVWAALTLHGVVKPNDVVGVIGVGGLGHLAIQFAKAMGCEVVVFSTTESKREQATQMGASHFITTQNKSELSVPRKINHLLVTASKAPDWKLFMPIMAKGGSIFPLTVLGPDAKLEIPYLEFLVSGLHIISTLPNLISYRSMLQFAAGHGIRPVIDKDEMTIEGISRSLRKLRTGEIRYRGVLYRSTED
ncbi:GroES-like protein [Penicillium odoratum]|uniref:GroES-like protein n=1 Tax=Penicillium odoratum TaxID=1167516 RepID=UPI00254809A5|nr:GroES-like protein [Penicillium odoratum]KAJ5769080.1 GroES-like protein [Penicillium odoratum]